MPGCLEEISSEIFTEIPENNLVQTMDEFVKRNTSAKESLQIFLRFFEGIVRRSSEGSPGGISVEIHEKLFKIILSEISEENVKGMSFGAYL